MINRSRLILSDLIAAAPKGQQVKLKVFSNDIGGCTCVLLRIGFGSLGGPLESTNFSHLLHTLAPKNAEEVSVLHTLVSKAMARLQLLTAAPDPEAERFAASLPDPDKRYFDGLLEAIEIYWEIYGRPISIESLSEVRRIRDLCLS